MAKPTGGRIHPNDLVPMLKRSRDITIVVQDKTGYICMLRPNFLNPPFDNLAIRQAIMGAISQRDFMDAAAGTDPGLSKTNIGVFCPVSPMANDAAIAALTAPRNIDRAKQQIRDAGYRGELVVVLGATDQPVIDALANVSVDLLKKLGFNVDYQATDWGTALLRRTNKGPPEKGGWSAFCTDWAGLDVFSPASDLCIRGNGAGGWFGWPDFPKMEALRAAWLDAPDLAAQKKIAVEIQEHFLQVVPYYPLGLLYEPTAFRKTITGVLNGFMLFWNVRPA